MEQVKLKQRKRWYHIIYTAPNTFRMLRTGATGCDPTSRDMQCIHQSSQLILPVGARFHLTMIN